MEFELIDFIKNKVKTDASVVIGIGDDAAVTELPKGHQLVVSTDTLVQGVHFDERLNPQDLGHKSLAVNLSDLAAMGATPKWFTLNLTLPDIDKAWIEEYLQGLLELASRFNVHLIGGDTTQGPLSITITAMGSVESDRYLQRSTALRGDLIAVTGQLGNAAFALDNEYSELEAHLKQPVPRLDVSDTIKYFASSCIDISDGLMSDLNHICSQSHLGAQVNLENLPIHSQVKNHPQWMKYVLSGGDDYQLCFTFSPKHLMKLPEDCTVIGQMKCGNEVSLFSNNQKIDYSQKGFIHFSSVK
jgi:thiamine-monophosphate kinase